MIPLLALNILCFGLWDNNSTVPVLFPRPFLAGLWALRGLGLGLTNL